MARASRRVLLPAAGIADAAFSTSTAISSLTQLFAFQTFVLDRIIITCRVHDGSANAATFTAEVKKFSSIDEEEENPQQVTVAVGKTRVITFGPETVPGAIRLLATSAGATVSYIVEGIYET